MSAARHLGSIARCTKCRAHALDGFLALAGVSLRTQIFPSRPTIYRGIQGRCFTSSLRTFAELNTLQTQRNAQTGPNVEREAEDTDKDTLNASHHRDQESELQEDGNIDEADSETPWYLQEEDDFVAEPSLSDRQKLPEIPSDAPKNFADIIERLSMDIGLDYLTLIDLRALDPPPALGTGVMMLIGTARSEKHLHVSADRFARWLRAQYKLTPHADGLLGRNELKLRLRRKAKRAKLLGSVGAVQRDDEDDGIKTGWICVDAGIIEHSSAVERSLDESGIIGFGSQSDGVKLVVQMMTESKRRELDLETLWEKALERHRKRLAARIVVDAPEMDDGSALAEMDTLQTGRLPPVASN